MTRYLEQVNECTDPTTGDYLWIYNTSAGATDKDQKVDAGRFAQKAVANTFTTTQTVAPTSTSVDGVVVNMPTANANYAINVQYNGTRRIDGYVQATASIIEMISADFSTAAGPQVSIGRNSNAGTSAAGCLQLMARSGTAVYYWTDNSGNFRLSTSAAPTSGTDTSGTIVGTQTSWATLKEDITPWDDTQAALDAVLACKLFGYRFKGDESRRQYHGIVITDEDRGAWFSENDADNQTPALNERNLFGHLIAAIQAQQAQIEELKAKVEELAHAN